MRLIRERDGAVVAGDLRVADGFFTRLRGLMGRAGLAPGEGLWIEPCSAIHMMFVRFAIDVLVLARDDRGPVRVGTTGQVLAVRPAVRPWLGMARCPGASSAVELESGSAARLGLAAGDLLRVDLLRAEGAA